MPLTRWCPLFLAALAAPMAGRAQALSGDSASARSSTAWYERLSLRGYTHLRYNRLLETNQELICAQCDRSLGSNQGFFLRRARLALTGQASRRLSVYLQVDLATDVSGSQHLLQLRDLYFDLGLDSARTHRLRFGQTKVPHGWENLQSSSSRYPLDRSDAINSGVPNERDLGVFYHWTPPQARRLFRVLSDSGLKGTGDYGVFAIGVYNGQSANRAEANNSLHAAARLSYPVRLPRGQLVEATVSGYHGRFVLLSRTPGVSAEGDYRDSRAAGSLAFFPQPIGFQAEWSTGVGPVFDAPSRTVVTGRVRGGYVQAMVRLRAGRQVITPYGRVQYFEGGKKAELDARLHGVNEREVGVEWLPFPALELTAALAGADRTVTDGTRSLPDHQAGHRLRLQAQFNY